MKSSFIPDVVYFIRIIDNCVCSVSPVDRDSSVGIATRYGLDGPGIESRWGRDFLHPSRLALFCCTMGIGLFPWVKRPGSGADPAPPSSVPKS